MQYIDELDHNNDEFLDLFHLTLLITSIGDIVAGGIRNLFLIDESNQPIK
jgi:hypothetical protein